MKNVVEMGKEERAREGEGGLDRDRTTKKASLFYFKALKSRENERVKRSMEPKKGFGSLSGCVQISFFVLLLECMA